MIDNIQSSLCLFIQNGPNRFKSTCGICPSEYKHMNNTQGMIQQQQNKIQSLLKQVGGEHRYQYILFFIFALKWVIAGMILFSLNFFYYVPEFQCTPQEMADYNTCAEFVCSYNSQKFWYQHLKKPLKSSIALDYGVIMVCSNEWVSSFLQSICYLGSLVGYIIMSHVADNYGRKKGELIAWGICIGGAILSILSFNLFTVGLGGFLLGFGSNGAINLHYSFFKELTTGKTRERMIIAVQLAFSLGISLISLLSYLIDNWKYTMGFFILIPCILSGLLFLKYIEQTPEFTLRSSIHLFLASFNRIAQINNKPQLDIVEVQQKIPKQQICTSQNEVTYLDLFRYQSLRLIAIVTGIINFSIEFIYDGTLLSLDKFGLNVYFNQMLVGLVEISAALWAVYIIPKTNRKRYTSISLIIITVVCVGMGIQILTYTHSNDDINYHTIIEMVLIAALRFLISSIWGVFFVYVSELYPNEVSSLSYGWVSITGTIGASLSPYIKLATANATMFVMGILSGLMVFLVRVLKETKGKPIRTRIKEREQLQNQKSDKQSVISGN